MRNKINTFCLFRVISIIMFGVAAQAQEGVQTSIHHHYESMRALGMGDAFIASTNDYSALFYNPAALARRESGQINLAIDAGWTAETTNLSKDFSDVSSKNTTTDAEKYNAYSELLQKYYGKTFTIRAKVFEGIWVRPNWGFGIVPADVTLDMQIHNQAAPSVDIRTYVDTTIAYAYAKDLKGLVPGRLSVGSNFKLINRGYANRQFNALDFVADSQVLKKEDLRDGYTFDMDWGTLYTPEVPSEGVLSVFQLAKPTFAAVVRNVVDMGFKNTMHLMSKDQVEAPERLYRVLDVGAKFEYPSLWIFGGRGEVDVRDIGHPNFTVRRALHVGFEFDWSVTTWWRGHYRVGLNQGYYTAGISAMLFIFNLDFATYGEEVGSYSQPKENRIYMAKLNIDI